jgi:hypothetical protein
MGKRRIRETLTSSAVVRSKLEPLALSFVALGAFAAVTGSASPASALPIPPPNTTGLHYYGCFADVRYDDAAATADHANVVLYGDGGNEAVGARSIPELQALVANPNTRTMGVVLGVFNEFFGFAANGVPYARATDDWQSRWSTYKQMIAPYQANIVSFYIYDEPDPTDAALMSFISTVALQLKADFPNIHRQVTFTARGLDSSTVTIPDGLDWVGYDCYPGPFEECYDKELYDPSASYVWRSVPYYYAMLRAAIARSNLSYRPSLVVVPQAWELASAPDTSVNAQAAVLARAEREVALAESDPDVAMIMPFLWDTIPSEALMGTVDLPMIKTYYAALGRHVVNGSARLAYPTSVGASASYSESAPSYAFDYSPSTAWNSGGYPIQQIYASFADPIIATQMDFVTAQYPAGFTEHILSGANFETSTGQIANFSGSTADSQTLTWTGSQPLNWVVMQTQVSPSWVAWRDISIFASGTTRLYPSPLSATSGAASLPSLVDGDPATVWGSGGYPPAAADLDLRTPQSVSRIELVVEQSPAGYTHHDVYGGPTLDTLSVLGSFDGNTQSGQVLHLSGPFTNVRYIRVQTTVSPSWVAWREINVFR